MAEKTPNYEFNTPGLSGAANITVQDANWEKLDEKLKSVDDSVATKVDKEDGKVLSSNDYTDAEKADVAKIKNIQTNLDNKASIGEVLRINVSNGEFTPIQPYHPATKKYVDDSVAGKAPAYTYGTTDLTAGVSALEAGVLYFVYE